jgi:pimeloyl-ACP methyl ester carboxylesterase
MLFNPCRGDDTRPGDLFALARQRERHAASRLVIPVLVVAGDHDFTSVEEDAEIFNELPQGELFIVPASNHGTVRARPDLVTLAVREFLDQPDGDLPTH